LNNSKKNYFINCSKKDLGGVILALKNSNFFVGNNSGPLNLAAALKVQSFGLIANDPVDELKFSKIKLLHLKIMIIPGCRDRKNMKKLNEKSFYKNIRKYKIMKALNFTLTLN
jgi:ADP-heptose:LPS heptosyltransferase